MITNTTMGVSVMEAKQRTILQQGGKLSQIQKYQRSQPGDGSRQSTSCVSCAWPTAGLPVSTA